MIINLIPIILTGYAPNNTFYPYGGKISYNTSVQSCIIQSENSNQIYYSLADVYFNVDISYDIDNSSYYLNNFTYKINASLYRNPVGSDEGIYVQSLTYTYAPNWEITQNTSNYSFDNVAYYISFNGYNDEFEIGVRVNDVVAGFTYTNQDFGTDTNSFSYIEINTSNFYDVLDQFISSGYSSSELADAIQVAKDAGYAEGLQDGLEGGQPSVIFSGILNVALLPVNMFLQILNFEVFGINIGALVTGLLTIAVVIIIVRLVTGKKND